MGKYSSRPVKSTADAYAATMRFYAPNSEMGQRVADKLAFGAMEQASEEAGFMSDPDFQAAVGHSFAGRIESVGAVRHYVLAGHAVITLVSKSTSARFTFKMSRPKESRNPAAPEQPIFVARLFGPDNISDYVNIGILWHDAKAGTIRWAPKRNVDSSAADMSKSMACITWFFAALDRAEEVLDQCEVWHEGRCGRCGRRLTVPESIASGFGPECIGKVF